MAITYVQNELIAVNAVSGTIIADNAITAVHIAQNAVTATQIPAGSIVTAQLGADAVTAAKLADSSVVTANIQDDQVTGDKLTDNITIAGTLGVTSNATVGGTLGVTGATTLSSDLSIPAKVIHVGDTDTYTEFDGADQWRVVTGGAERFAILGGHVVVNDDSHDADFRVESNSSTHMLFVDGGANTVGIGRTPSQSNTKLEVGGADNVPLIAAEASGVFAGLGTVSAVSGTGLYVGTTLKFVVGSSGQIGINGASYGTDGQVLTSGGSGAAAAWEDAGGASAIDDLSDAKLAGTNFTRSMILGHQTTGTLSSATDNTAVGYASLDAVTSGNHNTAIGAGTLGALTEGTDNVAIGSGVFANITTADENVGIGTHINVTSGAGNVAIGYYAMQGALTTGGYNIGIGRYAANMLTDGTQNTCVGHGAGSHNQGGDNNTFIGSGAGAEGGLEAYANNVAVGFNAMQSGAKTDATVLNVAVGYEALKAITTGGTNTAIGAQAMDATTTGGNNTAVGYEAAGKLTSGHENVAIGRAALLDVTTTSDNVAIGVEALENCTSGSNVAVGKHALRNTTGSYNVGIGKLAGNNITSGDENICVGYYAGNESQVINLTTENTRAVFGSKAITNAYVKVAWEVTSDARDKMNFEEVPHGLDFVNELQPIKFQFKKSRESAIPYGNARYGFKAQDILALEGDNPIIIDNENEDNLKYQGESLVPVLVNAIKELSAEVEKLKNPH